VSELPRLNASQLVMPAGPSHARTSPDVRQAGAGEDGAMPVRPVGLTPFGLRRAAHLCGLLEFASGVLGRHKL